MIQVIAQKGLKKSQEVPEEILLSRDDNEEDLMSSSRPRVLKDRVLCVEKDAIDDGHLSQCP